MDARRRRRAGLALIAAGLALAVAFETVLPPPRELEYALQDTYPDSGPTVASLAARGPAATRYDADTDTTVLVFQCAHDYCQQAVRVKGDARSLAGPGTALLDVPGWKGTLRVRELDPPMAVASPHGEEQQVTQVVDATLERQGMAAPVVLLAVALGAIAAGIGLQRSLPGAGPPLLATLAGMAAGLFVAVSPYLLLVAVPALALALLAGAGMAVAGGLRRPALQRAGVMVLLAGLAAMAAAWRFAPYFTIAPAM